MENKFDYTDMIHHFVFVKGNKGGVVDNPNLPDAYRSVASDFAYPDKKSPIPAYSNNIFKSVDITAAAQARYSVYDCQIEKGEDRSINILSKDGTKVAQYDVEIHVKDEARDMLLPNGDYGRDLEHYAWNDFEKLEDLIVEQELADGFSDAVASISEAEPELRQ